MSGGAAAFWVIVVLVVLALIYWQYVKHKRFQQMSPQEQAQELARRQAQRATIQYGPTNPVPVCPHCQTKGSVRTKAVTLNKGISGGKATGAVLTGGLSVLATGLSRKEGHTQAHCDHCNLTWHI